MKTSCLTVVLFLVAFNILAQKGKETKLTKEQEKDLFKQIKPEKSKLLNQYAVQACSCIDSIKLLSRGKKEVSEDVAACIDKQAFMYQVMVKTSEPMFSDKNNIEVNDNTSSTEYRKYYYELERWMMDSCASLKEAVKSDNQEAVNSMSKNQAALDEYYLGIEESGKEHYEEALAHCNRAVAIDPNFAFCWDNIGVYNRKLGRYDEALKAYNKSLEVSPNGLTPLQNIPVVYEFKKEYDKAIVGYQRMIKIYKQDPEGYFGLGRMYAITGDMENALQNICKAYNLYIIFKSPYRTDAESMIGMIYREMKKDGKVKVFNKILIENDMAPIDEKK